MALKWNLVGISRRFVEIKGLSLVLGGFFDDFEKIRGVNSNIAGQSLNGEESC